MIIRAASRENSMGLGIEDKVVLTGNVAPPNSRPRRSIRVSPRIDRLPNQSMALKPSQMGVFGLCTSRNNKRRMNVIPEIGCLCQYL